MVAHTYKLSTGEDKARVQGQPGINTKTPQKAKLKLKTCFLKVMEKWEAVTQDYQ